MGKIPPKLRARMEADPFYGTCCLSGRSSGKIEWHHNLIFAGKQVQEGWCILPLTEEMHRLANRKDIKEKLDWIMLNRGTDEELKRYSKAEDLIKKRERLNKIYGIYRV